MQLHEKIRFIRNFKGWSQEDMAEKLGMAVSGYAKIERGETDVNFSRLQQIAEVFELELSYLIGLNDKNVNLVLSYSKTSDLTYLTSSTVNINYVPTESIELKYEIEKLHLLVEQQKKEIDYLKQIIELMKTEIK